METPLTPMEFMRRTRRLHPQREAVVDGAQTASGKIQKFVLRGRVPAIVRQSPARQPSGRAPRRHRGGAAPLVVGGGQTINF